MKKCFRALLLMMIAALLISSAHAEHTVQEVRERYSRIARTDMLYAEKADLKRMTVGELTDVAEEAMLEYVRFMRWLAYVEEPLEISEDYTSLAQTGALLLAVADTPAHVLPQPEDFPDDLYAEASQGIAGSNIASINWMDTDVLRAAVEHFQRDEGNYNRYAQGHRRWLLSPALQQTGFGLANSDSGMTYVTMYVHDLTAESINAWDHIAWPSAGAFPAEYLYDATPWSVILNDRVYAQEHPELRITASCAQTDEVFVMDRLAMEDAPDAYWINTDPYGLGSAIIFRPASMQEFEQNQVWNVTIENLVKLDGSLGAIQYEVDMMALEPIPVRLIELDHTEITLQAGESAQISASVVPHWADDTLLIWYSSNSDVATVDVNGNVTAVAAGSCTITALGADNQSAECAITVK